MADVEPILIEEIVGGLSARLDEHELPYGRRHELAAFESGVEVDIAEDGVYNPGSDRVVLPVMQPRYLPMVMRGAFHDVFFVDGHARSQRDLFMKIAARANPVRVTWADDERQGLLRRATFGEQSKNDISYELTFFVAVPPTGTQSKKDSDGLLSMSVDPSDLLAQMKAKAEAQQLLMDALALRAEINAQYASLWSNVGTALDVALIATTAFANATLATPHQAVTAARQVNATCQSGMDRLTDLKNYADSLRADAAVNPASAPNQGAYWAWVFDTQDLILLMLDTLRTARQVAVQTVRKSTRLYRVQPGDTLESIALLKLGSRARSLDLGISQAELVPGRFVRIPEAA